MKQEDTCKEPRDILKEIFRAFIVRAKYSTGKYLFCVSLQSDECIFNH